VLRRLLAEGRVDDVLSRAGGSSGSPGVCADGDESAGRTNRSAGTWRRVRGRERRPLGGPGGTARFVQHTTAKTAEAPDPRDFLGRAMIGLHVAPGPSGLADDVNAVEGRGTPAL
jgi:hypothetical protein